MTKITRTIGNTMYYNAPEFILRLAKELRSNQTKAEKELWNILGAKKMMGLHFRRQHPINMYIVDFYCHTIRLAIEIDGGIHKKREKHENDLNRTAELERFDITVIRFSNNDVINNIEMVKIRIESDCRDLIQKMSPAV